MLFLAEQTPAQCLKIFNNLFIRAYRSPYAIQRFGSTWRTINKPLSDLCIQGHLDKKYWLGTRGPWYVVVVILDFDGWGSIDAVKDFLVSINIKEGSYLLVSSPSYWKDGSCHALIPVLRDDRVPTLAKAHNAFAAAVNHKCEVYPQAKRVIRAPFGKDQHILDQYGVPMTKMPWEEAVGWVQQLESVELSDLPCVQMGLPFKNPLRRNFRFQRCSEAEYLWEHGLQAKDTRYEAQFLIAQNLYRQNLTLEDARRAMKRWIRTKHNSFSEKVNAGEWQKIDGEIDRQTKAVWDFCIDHYPDAIHNLTIGITPTDLRWAAEVYPRDPINQRRFVHLVAYVRPRAHHEQVYIPVHVWKDEIAHNQTYIPFQADLENRGLLHAIRAYHRGGYCYKFHLDMPMTNESPIELDGRHADHFWDALLWTHNGDRQIIHEVTGIPRDTIHHQVHNRLIIPELEKSLIVL